jgi:UvrD-like helicase family protein/AAA domain-containing protein
MTITAKFPGTCAACGGPVVPGQKVEWDKAAKTVRHETCSAAETPEVDRRPSFAPTSEQTRALELFESGSSLAIEAGAGTGKTSTLLLLAQSTRRRGQYVAFNKAIVTEAGEKMPGNVTCSTAHSLAFRAVGKRYAARLKSPRMRSLDIAQHLRLTGTNVDGKYIGAGYLGGLAMRAITRFCQTADRVPGPEHVPYVEGIDPIIDGRRTYANNEALRWLVAPALQRAWDDLMSESGRLPFRHDHYLKAWHLDGPRINADFILFDEAQDANPVMVAIVAAQTHAQLVWVGDSQQQIYSFTGAVNALENVPAEGRTFLTQSFRFGPAVAEVANGILDRLEADLRLVGTESIASVVGPIAEPDAILCRTNATAVRTVLRLQSEGSTVSLVGGGDDVVRFAKAAEQLMNGGRTDHPELACFDDWREVQTYVEEDEQGSELRLLVSLVTEFGVETILDALDRTIRETDADVIVSTAHKAKGREWNAVQLAGDFPSPEKIGPEELRLLYVAATRAKRELDISAVDVLSVTVREEEDAEAIALGVHVVEPAGWVCRHGNGPEATAADALAACPVCSTEEPSPEPAGPEEPARERSDVEAFLRRCVLPGDSFDVIIDREVAASGLSSLDYALALARRAREVGASQSAVYAIHERGDHDLVIEWDD